MNNKTFCFKFLMMYFCRISWILVNICKIYGSTWLSCLSRAVVLCLNKCIYNHILSAPCRASITPEGSNLYVCTKFWSGYLYSFKNCKVGPKISKLDHVTRPRPLSGHFVVHTHEASVFCVHTKFEDLRRRLWSLDLTTPTFTRTWRDPPTHQTLSA